MWKGKSVFLPVYFSSMYVFLTIPLLFSNSRVLADAGLFVVVVMGICEPEQVKLLSRGDRSGGNKG